MSDNNNKNTVKNQLEEYRLKKKEIYEKQKNNNEEEKQKIINDIKQGEPNVGATIKRKAGNKIYTITNKVVDFKEEMYHTHPANGGDEYFITVKKITLTIIDDNGYEQTNVEWDTDFFTWYLAGIDISGCDLSGVSLENIDFEGANFQGVNFNKTSFIDINLKNVDFKGADLFKARINTCNLENVDFVEIDNVNTVNFYNNNLKNTNFGDMELIRNKLSPTTVTIACERGKLKVVKKFIESGTIKDVNTYAGEASDGDFRTLLSTATYYEQYEIVQYLLSLPGMDVSVANSDGWTAIMQAAVHNKKNLDVMKSLLNHKTCSFDVVNKKDKVGRTALDRANSNTGSLRNEIIELLTLKGALTSNELRTINNLKRESFITIDAQFDCAICGEAYKKNEEDSLLKFKCGHIFHKACIARWFSRATEKTCPVCRSKNVNTFISGDSLKMVTQNHFGKRSSVYKVEFGYKLKEKLKLKF